MNGHPLAWCMVWNVRLPPGKVCESFLVKTNNFVLCDCTIRVKLLSYRSHALKLFALLVDRDRFWMSGLI